METTDRAVETTDRETDERARELRSDIERTRDDITETVDAIQEKLRPGNVVASAASATREKVRNMAYSASDTAQDWWDGGSGERVATRVRRNPAAAVLAGVGLAWLAFGDGGRRYDRDGRHSDYRDQPSGRRLANAQPMIRRTGQRLEMMLRDYPLAVGIAAAILGASLGMVVPETERENELMGETRDRALQRAKDAASGAVDRAKDAAADVVTRTAMGQ